jgi:predicted phage tail protein
MVRLSRLGSYKDVNREFKLRVIRQTANARQRKILRYQAIKSINELAVLKLEYISILSTQERKYETKTFNENVAKKVRTCRLPFPET